MKFYIGSGLQNAPQVRQLAQLLKAAGWEHTYDWTASLHTPLSLDTLRTMGEREFQGVKDADVVITDVWTSMGQEEERQKREAAFAGYCVDEQLMAQAKPDAMVQHCLPAHRGEEITEEVFEANAQYIFEEAENRLHAQKAVLVKTMGGLQDK